MGQLRLGYLHWVLLWGGVLGTPLTALADTSVIVLGIRSLEGDDDFARNLTAAIQSAATQVPDWSVSDRRVSLMQMTLAHGCDEPDAACMQQVSAALEVQRVVYGTVRRTSAGAKYDFSLALYLFDAEAGQIAESVADSIPRIQSDIDDLRPRAARYIRQFAGQAGSGSLRISVNVAGATVRVDGDEMGTTDEDGNFTTGSILAGRHQVGVTAKGHEALSVAVTVVADEEASLEASLLKEGGGPSHPVHWYTYASLGAGVTFLVAASVALKDYYHAKDRWSTARKRAKIYGDTNDPSVLEGDEVAMTMAFQFAGNQDKNICPEVRAMPDDSNRAARRLCSNSSSAERRLRAFGAVGLVFAGAGVGLLMRDLGNASRGDAEGDALSRRLHFGTAFGRHGASFEAQLSF